LHADADFSRKLSITLQEMYDQAATCERGLLSPVPVHRGRSLLLKLGYPELLVGQVPERLLNCAFPCANPLARIIDWQPANLVDLGCGAGFDLLFATLSLPELKSLAGIEHSPGLLARARELFKLFPECAKRIELAAGDLNRLTRTKLPTVDLILMNGSFNLVCDKPRLLRLLARQIIAGGRILICDFLLNEPLPPGFSEEPDNWLWNIAGALTPENLTAITENAGLRVIEIRELETITPVTSCEIVLGKV
jgi:SAM-dependent methyltransferase